MVHHAADCIQFFRQGASGDSSQQRDVLPVELVPLSDGVEAICIADPRITFSLRFSQVRQQIVVANDWLSLWVDRKPHQICRLCSWQLAIRPSSHHRTITANGTHAALQGLDIHAERLFRKSRHDCFCGCGPSVAGAAHSPSHEAGMHPTVVGAHAAEADDQHTPMPAEQCHAADWDPIKQDCHTAGDAQAAELHVQINSILRCRALGGQSLGVLYKVPCVELVSDRHSLQCHSRDVLHVLPSADA